MQKKKKSIFFFFFWQWSWDEFLPCAGWREEKSSAGPQRRFQPNEQFLVKPPLFRSPSLCTCWLCGCVLTLQTLRIRPYTAAEAYPLLSADYCSALPLLHQKVAPQKSARLCVFFSSFLFLIVENEEFRPQLRQPLEFIGAERHELFSPSLSLLCLLFNILFSERTALGLSLLYFSSLWIPPWEVTFCSRTPHLEPDPSTRGCDCSLLLNKKDYSYSSCFNGERSLMIQSCSI